MITNYKSTHYICTKENISNSLKTNRLSIVNFFTFSELISNYKPARYNFTCRQFLQWRFCLLF